MQEELADVGQDRGLARGNAVGGGEEEKISGDLGEGDGGIEFLDGADELQSDGSGFSFFLLLLVLLLLASVEGAEGWVSGTAALAATASERGN